jgi:hypothetical protein
MRAFHSRSAQGDEKLIQLLERLAHSTRTPRGDGTVESFLRGIEVVHNDQRLVTSFFKGHRAASAYGTEALAVCEVCALSDSIFSTHFLRHSLAAKGSAKYCVSCATFAPLNSIMLTV